MKIFITGSSGFIGRHFLEKVLLSFPKEEIVLLQRSVFITDNPNIRAIEGNLHDVDGYKADLIDSDYVFHIAASADVTSSEESVLRDFTALEDMISILKGNSNLKRFVFLSTIGAYDRGPNSLLSEPITNRSISNPRSSYGQVKLRSEKVISESGIPFTIFRPSWVWGKGMRSSSHIAYFNRLIEKGSLITRLGFPGRASFVHVDDLAFGLLKTINDDNQYLNKSYFVATETQSIGEIIKLLWKANHKSSWLLPLGFLGIFNKLHSVLPLPINFLFFDYLVCDSEEFCTSFRIQAPKNLKEGISSVLHRDSYAVVTGANNGIGFELSKLLERRFHLVLMDKDVSNIKTKFPNSILLQVDLANRDELFETLKRLKLNKKVSLVINNAGVGFKTDFLDTQIKKDLLTIDVNINAPLILAHAFKNDLLKSRGMLVNIASSVGHFPLPYMSTYAASKCFISSWSQGIEKELQESIDVITFSPSGTRTNFQKEAGVKDSRDLMGPSQVAEEILKSILRGKSDFRLIGMKSKILIKLMTFLPRKIGLSFIAKLFQGNR